MDNTSILILDERNEDVLEAKIKEDTKKTLNDAKAYTDAMSSRVSNLLNELTQHPDYAPTAEVVDIRTGYDGTIHAVAGDAVRAIGHDLTDLADSLQDYVDKKAVDGLLYEDNMLYLTAGGEIVSDPIEIVGGSGTSGSSSVIKLRNECESTISVSKGSSVQLKFNFTSIEDDVPTGDGTAKIIVNGATKATQNIPQGSNVIDITNYILDGTNTVRLVCSDVYGNSRTLKYTVNVISLSISSTFDDTIIYDGDITFKFTPIGLVSKTVYFVVDGNVIDTMVVTASGKQNAKIIPAMSHGSHKLVVYAEAQIDGATITSNKLVYDIMCVVAGNNEIIISCPLEGGNVSQGDLIEIPFSVYNPSNLTANVTLTITSGDEVYFTQYREVDRTRQVWSTRQYPIGEVAFVISCGDKSKTVNFNVSKNSIPVEAVTSDLELFLSSAGRNNSESNREVWESNGISTTFSNVNWVSTGWVEDSNGDAALHLAGDAMATVGFKPFSTDSRQTGRTVEIEFAIRDVNNRDAVVVSCMNGGIGIEVTADKASIYSEQSVISCNYKDNEKLRVSFVVESKSEYRLLCVYLNGILSGAIQYPENDNFQQANPVDITIGSPYCSIDIYTIRSYENALTEDQIRDNYIADTLDVIKKEALYKANNIYDDYGKLSFDALVDKIPVMVITGDLPTSKGDKKDVVVTFTDPVNKSLNFEDSAVIDVQGTSSVLYVRKNYKIETVNEHQFDLSQMAGNLFCMKADYAEDTGTHNTGHSNFEHHLYGDIKTPPQESNDKVRTTIYGIPCVMFHKTNTSSTPEFIGQYNYNWDKGTTNVFGFDSTIYPNCQSWEFCNNTSDACLFHGEIPSIWKDDFEARYPDKCQDISSFKVMHDWVVSTWQDGATGDTLDGTYTDVDGNIYTNDTREYRLAKFKTEFEEHFDKGFTLLYYVYTLVMLMVDQRAKNMFLTTWDGIHFQPWFYDQDTSFGINNEGALVFDYFHEDIDQYGGANVYNGQDSTLWTNFREAFGDEIQAMYQDLRSNSNLTYDKIMENFITNHSDKWSISVYNEDADYKYISMLRSNNDASNLGQIRGSGKEHLGYFIKNRLEYLDSKFYATEYADDYIAIRIYTPDTYVGVEPNANITITPFSDMYVGVRYKANGTLQQVRTKENTPVTIVAPAETFNDTETAIYGASEISSIGDLSPLYCGYINVANATKLTELIIGSDIDGYSNTYLKELSVGANKLLKKIDVRNCPNLTAPLALANCPNIQEIYATGSGITGVELPKSGYLKKIYLPSTITNLTVQNQHYIEEFKCDGYSNLTTLRVENAPNIPVETILKNASSLNRVRLLDVDLTINDANVLKRLHACGGLDEQGNNTTKPVITGKATVTALIPASKVDYWNAAFPDLELTFTNIGYMVTFKNDNGVVLKEQAVASGGNAIPPSAPSKESDDMYDYTFTGWDVSYKNITADTVCTAVYTASLKRYTVRFFDGDTLVQEKMVTHGEDAVYTGSALSKEHEAPDLYFWIVAGWSPNTENVTSDLDVYAQWESRTWPMFKQGVYPGEHTEMPHLFNAGDLYFCFYYDHTYPYEDDIYYISTDLINWEAHIVNTYLGNAEANKFVYQNGLYFAIHDSTNSSIDTTHIVYSEDGISWKYSGAEIATNYGLSDILWDGTNYIAVGDGDIYVISEDLSTIISTYPVYDHGGNVIRYDNGIIYVMGTTQNSDITYSATKDAEYLENLTQVTISRHCVVEHSVVEDGVIYCVSGEENSTHTNCSMAKITIKNGIPYVTTSGKFPVVMGDYNVHYNLPVYKLGEFMITGMRTTNQNYGEAPFILIATTDGTSFVAKRYEDICYTYYKMYANEKHIVLATNTVENGFYYAVNTL